MTTTAGSTLHIFGALLLAIAVGGCTETADPGDGGGDGGGSSTDAGHLAVCSTPAILFYTEPFAATVEATGEVFYSHTGEPLGGPPDLTGTLLSVDASTLHLMTATGTTDIVVHPVDAAALEALPIGTEVRAHFEEGLVLTAASDGALLLAVVSARHVAAPDAGPFRFTQGATTCLSAEETGFGCAHGAGEADVDVVAEGYAATLHANDPPVTATVGGRAFSLRVVRSIRVATEAELRTQLPDLENICADALPEELAFVVTSE